MNKIPKYSLMLIFPNILYAAKNYARQLIKKRKFKEHNFPSYNDSISGRESYREINIMNQGVFVLSNGNTQFVILKIIRKSKNQ